MSSDLATLTFVDTPAAPETFNVLAYGPPKSGKSTAAATAPGPILWVNAEGPGALSHARKVAAQRKTQILEVRIERDADARALLRQILQYVRGTQDPRPRTVVLDTLAKVRDALVRQMVDPGSKNSLKQYGEVNRILNETISILRDAPVNMILLAHENVQDADGDRIVEPLIGGALTQFAQGEVDVLAYTGIHTDEQTGVVSYVGQLVEGRGRRAGDRSAGLGAWRPLDFTEWLGVYSAALTPDDSDLPWAGDAKEGAA
ncbi:MAG TPA: AAA family ATPase [Solirubrobacteraceae bacterium]|nr:AAA family ATPase [Solirubrobacteraceae bacterium]